MRERGEGGGGAVLRKVKGLGAVVAEAWGRAGVRRWKGAICCSSLGLAVQGYITLKARYKIRVSRIFCPKAFAYFLVSFEDLFLHYIIFSRI